MQNPDSKLIPLKPIKVEKDFKKMKENEDAQKVLLVFEDTFKDEKNKLSTPKAFVKGGVIDPTLKEIDEKEKGDIYMPSLKNKASSSNKPIFSDRNIWGSSDSSKFDRDSKQRNIDSFFNEMKLKRQQQEKTLPNRQCSQQKTEDKKNQSKSKPSNSLLILENFKYNKDVENEEQTKSYYEQVYSVFDTVIKQETHHFDEDDSNSIFITNLTPEMNEEKIKKLFETYGEIKYIKILTISKENTRIPKIVCYITFKNKESAFNAKTKLDKKFLYDTIINVRYGRSKDWKTELEKEKDEKK